MSRQRRKREIDDNASPDLTPMIDVTFQLLIFFILCTRFKVDERNMRVNLPKDEGHMKSDPVPPREQLTIYCVWDADAQANRYVVAIDARGRKPVENSYARLDDLVIFPGDGADAIRQKKARYQQLTTALTEAAEAYIQRSGTKIEKIEISFAKDATVGAASGTAPWMFVSTAVDAATLLNQHREKAHRPALALTFKFADALGVYRH